MRETKGWWGREEGGQSGEWEMVSELAAQASGEWMDLDRENQENRERGAAKVVEYRQMVVVEDSWTGRGKAREMKMYAVELERKKKRRERER